jgi:hypothetical protein
LDRRLRQLAGIDLACPFGTSAVAVGASNNGLSFSTPVALTINVTSFDRRRAIECHHSSGTGGDGPTVSAQGGPFADAIVLGCNNLPPGAGTVQSAEHCTRRRLHPVHPDHHDDRSGGAPTDRGQVPRSCAC